jgi:hypothetical protein
MLLEQSREENAVRTVPIRAIGAFQNRDKLHAVFQYGYLGKHGRFDVKKSVPISGSGTVRKWESSLSD